MIDWNIIITGIVTLVSAIIGGVIAAKATKSAAIKGAELAWENERNRQAEVEKSTVRGFLLAIRTEVETIWHGYVHEVSHRVENLRPGEPFLFTYRLRQHYFTVYETNCHLIGHVDDDELRWTIIETYVRAKGLIDSHLVNNDLIDDYNTSTFGTSRHDLAMNNLISFAPEIVSAYEQVRDSVSRLIPLINESPMIKPAVDLTCIPRDSAITNTE